MKIRLDEQIITLGDYNIVRVDDYNLELQKDGELQGYYGFMCHAVREAFKRTMNDIRDTGAFNDILGDEEQVAETSDDLFKSVPAHAVYDFSSKAKEELLG
jgi:hypothetical protein